MTTFQPPKFRLLLSCLLLLLVTDFSAGICLAGVELSVGSGMLSGYTQYEIGGKTIYPDSEAQYHFPVSRLRFPVDATMVKATGQISVEDRWLFSLEVATNITEDTGEMKDYDWGIYPGSDTDQLDIYSESDCEMETFQLDIKGRYQIGEFYFGHATAGDWRFVPAFGGGFKYQHFDFNTYDLDQWSPSHPDEGHVREGGKVLSYLAAYEIPYVELSWKLTYREKLSFDVGLAYAPWLNFRDRDDHLLRDRVSKADHHWNGSGAMVNSSVRYDLADNWFMNADLELVYLNSKGRTDVYDAGAWHHSITEKIQSRQTSIFISLGYRF